MTDERARHLDLCLGCRNCEAVCPSGVPYGRILEQARAALGEVKRPGSKRLMVKAALRQVVGRPRVMRAAGSATRLAQRAGLTRLVAAGRSLPQLEEPFRAPKRGVAPALGERRFKVAFLTGCVMPVLYPAAHSAAVSLLQLAGCDVWFAPGQACCGALAAHSGDLIEARRLSAANEIAFGKEEFDALVVDSAGCGAHLKDFYPELGRRTEDLTEFLVRVGLPEPRLEVPIKVTYQDPCHLAHAQGVKSQPRELIRSVPGLELVEMIAADQCCGAAGLYSALEPDFSRRILEKKLETVMETGAEAVVTANPGCQMQLEAGLRGLPGAAPRVVSLPELVLAAYKI